MKKEPFVSIVIVTADRLQVIMDCLEELYRQDYASFEIIVIDASEKKIKNDIMERFPKVIYYYSEIKNTPHQRNLGIKKAKGEIIAFIDDDSMVRKGWLKSIVVEYKFDEIGGVGGFVEQDDMEMVSKETDAIGEILSNGRFSANFGSKIKKSREVDHLMGCNMSFRKEALEKIGMLDTEYKGTCFAEETDISTRIKQNGYKIIFTPFAKVKHLAAFRPGYSRDKYNMKFQYYHARNVTYFFVKNYGFKKIGINFIVLDTANHLKSYFIRIIHTIVLIFLNIYGKVVGIYLGLKYRIQKRKY